MINTNKKILIYDDTSRGETFEVTEILFENGDIILVNIINEYFDNGVTYAIINKITSTVSCEELSFYLAENFI